MSATRISAKRRTARWDPDGEVSAGEAMDFWSFAAAAANVVMQLAWPEVGYGVAESTVDSGSILKHPWKRLRTTSQYLAVAVFGNEKDRGDFRQAVDVAHRQVISTPDSPVSYNAFDRELQMWVAACLFVGLEDTYLLLRGEMTPEQAEQFYRSSWTLGTTLQVTEDQWPPTRTEFDAYWDAGLQEGRHRRRRAYLPHGSDQPADDQPRSGTALSAAAQVPDGRLSRSGVQRGVGCPVDHGQAKTL